MAPTEVPAKMSNSAWLPGSVSITSAMPETTPTSYAPRIPPPESTKAVGGRGGRMTQFCPDSTPQVQNHTHGPDTSRSSPGRLSKSDVRCNNPRDAQMSATIAPSARPSAALTLKAAGRTDIGRRRQHNEDVVLVREDLGLFLVADGAGGHNAGEVASALAARSIENYFGATIRATHEAPEFNRLGMPNGARRLSSAVHKANRDVVEIARSSPKHRGMGTTVVACCFSPRSGLMHVAHVGDSRCYRMRDGDFELLTQDHSLLTDVLEQRPELDDDVLA